jgi:nucleoporin GLE1
VLCSNSDQANPRQRQKIQEIFRQAWANTGVALDAREYILRPEQPFPPGAQTQVSGTFIYLLNMLVKLAIPLMLTSATITTYNAIDPIGVVLSWIASHSDFRLNGNSFADVYLAKYHATAPVLFGISGPETTAAGRARLRWQRVAAEDGAEPGWVTKQAYYDRLHGATVGWAALTLRDFSRVKSERSALPAWRFWRSVAALVNVPPQRLQRSHAVALRALVDQYAHLFVKFYGKAAVAALRKAVVEVPASAPAGAGFEMVAVVRDNLRAKYGLVL